jgi:glucokinase
MKRTPERAAAGIDVGGTFTKIGIVSSSGRLLRDLRLDTRSQDGPESFVRRVTELLESWRRSGLRFDAAGLAIAGDVDSRGGLLRFSPNLKGWDGFPLRNQLARRLKMPVVMDNDANLAVWGAYVTELKAKPANVFGVTLGTGVGGGVVIDHRLFHGSTGSAGEIGHLRVEIGGEPCHCGLRGCLEAYAGSYGIVRRARRALEKAPAAGRILRGLCPDLKSLAPADISTAAHKGDALAREVLAETGSYLGAGLASLVLVLNPDAVLIMGGVSRAGKWLVDPIRECFKRQPFKTPFSKVKLIVADNPDAGRVGAALFALSEGSARA